tara:strand:- start:817 stop:1584 length:768 start_codon:yes stop_codon:yes gene_type:complete
MNFQNLGLAVRAKTPIDIGSVFGDCFGLFQKVWLQGLLLQALTVLVLYGVAIIMYIPLMGTVFVMEDPSATGDELFFSVLTLVVFVFYFLVYILVAIFQVGLTAAFYRIMRLKDRGIATEIGVNFGMFFKKKYFVKLTLIALINLVILVVATLLFVLPIFFVIIPIQFVILFFAFHPQLSIKEIYALAFSLGTRKWGTSFVILLGMFVFSLLGLFLCFIGILATISCMLIPVYIIYKEVVGFREVEDAIQSIGEE